VILIKIEVSRITELEASIHKVFNYNLNSIEDINWKKFDWYAGFISKDWGMKEVNIPWVRRMFFWENTN